MGYFHVSTSDKIDYINFFWFRSKCHTAKYLVLFPIVYLFFSPSLFIHGLLHLSSGSASDPSDSVIFVAEKDFYLHMPIYSLVNLLLVCPSSFYVCRNAIDTANLTKLLPSVCMALSQWWAL